MTDDDMIPVRRDWLKLHCPHDRVVGKWMNGVRTETCDICGFTGFSVDHVSECGKERWT